MKRFAFALGLLALFLFAVPAVAENDLWCRFFDVGKADAALLVLPDGSRIMIDAGKKRRAKRWPSGSAAAESTPSTS